MVFLPRHGLDGNTPPHGINHKANMKALADLNVEFIVGVSSVGSLKPEISPGCLFVPSDYINLSQIPTFFDDRCVHVTPGLDEELMLTLSQKCRELGVKVVGGGVYVQTQGPRLETKAEIKIFAGFGDVVGMTMASEATLAREVSLRYASLCSVDNYAHGLAEGLDFKDIKKRAAESAEIIWDVLGKVIR
jgi:5'-methylthioadenosine phosphorylase